MFEYLCANGSLSACVTALKFGSWQSAALFCSVFRYCGIAVSAQCSLKVKQLALRVIEWEICSGEHTTLKPYRVFVSVCLLVPCCAEWSSSSSERNMTLFWRYNLGKTVIKNAPIICPHFIQFHASWEGERSRFLLSPYIYTWWCAPSKSKISRSQGCFCLFSIICTHTTKELIIRWYWITCVSGGLLRAQRWWRRNLFNHYS